MPPIYKLSTLFSCYYRDQGVDLIFHRQAEHGTLIRPPPFTYMTLATHKDPLLRQLHEAILIRIKGDLNRKCEFASNEIIRLQSKGYSWKEEQEQRYKQQQEHILKSSLKMTPYKPEEPALAKARTKVSAIEHGNSHESFRVRSLRLCEKCI